MEEFSANMITIVVRSPKERKDISLDGYSTIKELKGICAREFVSAVEQLCVIFSGKILDDSDLLQNCGIRDGATVHLVIKSAHHTSDESSGRSEQMLPGLPAADVSATPFGLASLGGLSGLSSLGMGSANFMDLQQHMMREMVSNPEMMRTLLDSPFVQQMMSSPDTMRSMMTINPQLREVMEKNPEIMQTMADPELMKRMVDVVRSPAMLQELMRGQEHFIGGMRIPSAGTSSSDRSSRAEQSSPAKSSSATSEPKTNELFNDAGARSMLLQIAQNPQLMTNMVQAPYVQCMLTAMSQNQELVHQMLANSPMFANKPALLEQLPGTVPYFAQQLQNPEIQCILSNPRALQAMLLIQQGMQELHAASPSSIGENMTLAVDEESTSDPYTQYISRMLNMVSTANSDDDTQSAEQKFALQLFQLSVMGFSNKEANIDALSATQGDVNSAIGRLLQQQN